MLQPNNIYAHSTTHKNIKTMLQHCTKSVYVCVFKLIRYAEWQCHLQMHSKNYLKFTCKIIKTENCKIYMQMLKQAGH